MKELEDTHKVLEAALTSLERSHQKAKELEQDRDSVVASLAASIPEALDNLTGDEVNTVYRKLRLQLIPSGEGFDATCVLCTLEPTSRGKDVPRLRHPSRRRSARLYAPPEIHRVAVRLQ